MLRHCDLCHETVNGYTGLVVHLRREHPEHVVFSLPNRRPHWRDGMAPWHGPYGHRVNYRAAGAAGVSDVELHSGQVVAYRPANQAFLIRRGQNLVLVVSENLVNDELFAEVVRYSHQQTIAVAELTAHAYAAA